MFADNPDFYPTPRADGIHNIPCENCNKGERGSN